MIRIALCDNDIHALESLFETVQAYASQHDGTKFFIRRFQSVYDLLECVENPSLRFQIYFLNTRMPISNGFEVGHAIRKTDDAAHIVYTCEASDHQQDYLGTAPLQYLVKPIAANKVNSLLDSACRKVSKAASRNLLIKHKEGLSNVSLRHIEYVEYRDHSLTFHLVGGQRLPSRVIRKSFTNVMKESFMDPRFIRPHESFIVNMDEVQSIVGYSFQLASGTVVPISRRVFTSVKKSFVQHVTDRGAGPVMDG